MRITVDNEDGRGAVDYTTAVAADGPVTIYRALNAPSRCQADVLLGLDGRSSPARKGRVVVRNDAGSTLFTGYLATEPVAMYAGIGVKGAMYKARLNAISDEWLLDRQGSGAASATDGFALALDSTNLVAQLVSTAQGSTSAGLVMSPGENPRAIGAFAVQPSASWSTNAAAAANATYTAYRVLAGTVSVTPAGSVTHGLSDADGTLNLAEFSAAHVRELANDVTLSGEEEAAAYVQEVFSGDGTTTAFELSQAVFRGTHRTLLQDSFGSASFDSTQWSLSDSANHLQLTSLGLTMSGGNGLDGQTTLTAVNAIEMSGFVLAELGGVRFGPAASGMLAGFYSGTSELANCFAGFRVRQSASATGGVTVLVPVIDGAEAGAGFTPESGHAYTLRLRLFCVEMQRVPQRFYCMVDGDVQEFGSLSGIGAPMHLVFEVVDEGASSNTPATILYDTVAAGAAVPVTTAACSFVAVNSENLYGSIASLQVTRPGSLWVTSLVPNGAQMTRLTGGAGQGVDCDVSYGSPAGSAGKITFFAGRVPVAGERITVCYRTSRRAVARLADTASMAAEATAGSGVQVPGVSRWLGKVLAPVARSSMDCEAAAQAVLAMSTARSAALSGSYQLSNPGQDVWPGDVLQITSDNVTTSLLVRTATLQDGHAAPEVIRYQLGFANTWATEWADGLGLKLSEAIAADAVLPAAAADASQAAQVLPDLQQLAVVSLTGTALQVDAGMPPPAGGGFEVRRRDWVFGAGVDIPDLVLRSPVRSFSIPRSAQIEQFFVRMYDGSTPPVYSRFSAALVIHWPLG